MHIKIKSVTEHDGEEERKREGAEKQLGQSLMLKTHFKPIFEQQRV